MNETTEYHAFAISLLQLFWMEFDIDKNNSLERSCDNNNKSFL